MAEVEFIFNGVKTIIQCKLNEKMESICQKFIDKSHLSKNNIYYSYDAKSGINGELTFEEIANSDDKKRKKMSILAFDNNFKNKEEDIIKSKHIICPECKENIKMDIKDFKINLYDCKNKHKIDNLLLNEFEETQKIDRLKIICDLC